MKRLHVAFPLLSVVLLAIMSCTSDPVSTKGGTETGDAMVTGMIVDGNGSPVKGATVRMVPVGFDARQLAKRLAKTRSLTATELRAALLAAVDSAVTDSNGEFSFDTVDTGTYNVLADSGTNLAYQDSVAVEPDTQTTVPTDTLKAPGSVRGVVRLQPGDDSRKVFVIALGTFAVTAPSDSIGNFAMADMAEGTYSTRILSTLDDYGVLDTVFSVTAGAENVLTDTIALPYTGIPVPAGLSIAYDTLKQIVTLTWNAPTTGRPVKGYNVYRKHADSTSFEKIAGVVADTLYVDSSAAQDQTYEYKVAAVDSLDTEGTKSGAASAVITSAFLFVRSITMPDSGSSTYNEPGEMAFDLSGNLYVIDLLGNVLKYDAQGISLGAWSTGANEARDIEVLGDSVFVLDRTNKEIIVFNTSGTAQGQWSIDSTSDPMNFVVKHAAVYIVDKQSNHILKYSLTGDSIGKWSGDGNNSFKSLKCIATNPKSDYLYVLDSDSVGFVLDTAGSLISQFTIPHEFAFSAYTQWFLLHDNNLIYGGKNNFKILVIDLTGKLFAQFGRFGSGPGEFKYPYSIAEAPDNMVYVADKQNSRIQVFRR